VNILAKQMWIAMTIIIHLFFASVILDDFTFTFTKTGK